MLVKAKVSVNFNATGPYDTASWTDITTYVISYTIDIGRKRDLDGFETGHAKLTLDNKTRRFDPVEPTGPYFGLLRPNLPMKIEVVYQGVTYTRFAGLIDGWPQSYERGANSLSVPCSDRSKILATTKLPGSVYELEVEADDPDLWLRYDEPVGTSFADHGQRRTPVSTSTNNTSLERGPDLLVDAGKSAFLWNGGARVSAVNTKAEPITVEFWFLGDLTSYNNNRRGWAFLEIPGTDMILWIGRDMGSWVETQSRGLVWVMSLAGPGAYVYLTTKTLWDGALHHVVAIKRSGGSGFKFYIDGVDTAFTTAGAPTGIVWPQADVNLASGGYQAQLDGTVVTPNPRQWYTAEPAIYYKDLGLTRSVAHYQAGLSPWSGDQTDVRVGRVLDLVGWPSSAGWRSLDIGGRPLGAARLQSKYAWDYLRSLESAEGGQMHCYYGDLRFENRRHRDSAPRSIAIVADFTDQDPNLPAAGHLGSHRYSDPDLIYDDLTIYNEVHVKWAGGEIVVSDQDSIDSYGTLDYSVTTELSNPSDATQLGYKILTQHAQPAQRLRSLTIQPSHQQVPTIGWALGTGTLSISAGLGGPDNYLPACACQVSDRVRAHRIPEGSTASYDRELFIEGVSEEMTSDKWTLRLSLSEV